MRAEPPLDSVVAMRPCRELPNALVHIDGIRRRLEECRPALFLDYDGTLAAIAPRPELAVMTPAMRRVLTILASVLPVAIVSGRNRADVEALVAIPSLIYAGNHGFDIAGGGLLHDVGAGFAADLEAAGLEIAGATGSTPGLILEAKARSLAVHYRLVDVAAVGRIEAAVERVAKRHPRLRLMKGRKIFELLPDIAWDKGQAVLWLLEALALTGAATLPFYIGDDVTDEDAFRALAGSGVAIRVLGRGADGRREDELSAAHYRLEGIDEVRRLLNILADIAGQAPAAPDESGA